MKRIEYNDKEYLYFEKSVCICASEHGDTSTTIIKYELEEMVENLPDNFNIILNDQTFDRKSIIVMYDGCNLFNLYTIYEFVHLEFTYQNAEDITKVFERKEKIEKIINRDE